MVISYEIGDTLYINITNRCSNRCTFCVRNKKDSVGDADSLWLPYEPSIDEILKDISSRDLSQYKEVCFCGFGESTSRLFDMIYIAKKIKEIRPITVRLNTNGHANYIFGADVTPLFYGCIDIISVSLNAKNAAQYDELCRPEGDPEEVFPSILDFAKNAKKYTKSVIMTVLDFLSPEDIEACRKLCENVGADFRVRNFIP